MNGCEAFTSCKCRADFWAQRSSMNLLVCGRHLPGTVRRFRATDHATAHPSYHLSPGDAVIVKVRDGRIWR
jgi:protein involved in polysaccharide export with SLBB domain